MKKILLIEDDAYIRDVTATRLLQHSYEVVSASTGEEGLTLIESQKPDIVLVDLDLPDVYGLDIVKEILQNETLKHIPVIVFTNNDSPEIVEKVKQSGAVDLFNKSQTDFDTMLATIEKNLNI